MSLDELRKKIDKADAEIVRLIAERIKVAEEIGGEKKKEGRQITDAEREKIVLENVRELARKERINQDDIESIYRQIMTVARSVEGIQVAFQGEVGAYSEEAAFNFFGSSILARPCESLEEVFRTVEHDEVQYGVVAIENSLEGTISQSYDLLLDSEVRVCGETELRIGHCLIASAATKLDSVRKVYSHPQALGQCQAFLKQLNFELIPTYDTAGSVKIIKENRIVDGAAIASARAAGIYGMKILAKNIEDNPNNFTRFFILAKQDTPPTGNDKTSIVFSVKHRPGALYEFLSLLAQKEINLSKIESRPTRQKPWEYNFYLDFDGHRQDKAAQEVLNDLAKISIFVKVLGSYPKAK